MTISSAGIGVLVGSGVAVVVGVGDGANVGVGLGIGEGVAVGDGVSICRGVAVGVVGAGVTVTSVDALTIASSGGDCRKHAAISTNAQISSVRLGGWTEVRCLIRLRRIIAGSPCTQ